MNLTVVLQIPVDAVDAADAREHVLGLLRWGRLPQDVRAWLERHARVEVVPGFPDDVKHGPETEPAP